MLRKEALMAGFRMILERRVCVLKEALFHTPQQVLFGYARLTGI